MVPISGNIASLAPANAQMCQNLGDMEILSSLEAPDTLHLAKFKQRTFIFRGESNPVDSIAITVRIQQLMKCFVLNEQLTRLSESKQLSACGFGASRGQCVQSEMRKVQCRWRFSMGR